MQSDFSRFKQEINLSEYAAMFGYKIDAAKSTRASVAMKHDNGDKVVISKRGASWVYFCVHDGQDNGTIIDFVLKRSGKALAEIARDLTDWLGGSSPRPSPHNYVKALEPNSTDRARVKRIFRACKPVRRHTYLEQQRNIAASIIASARFANRLFADRYGNAAFPHYDLEGLCGLELKNEQLSVMTKGSEKGLWLSNRHEGDTKLVVTESVINALSYQKLFPTRKAAYGATGGTMRGKQFDILLACIKKMPDLGQIILAVDPDAGGERIAACIEAYLTGKGINPATIIRHIPKPEQGDWNDVLKAARI